MDVNLLLNAAPLISAGIHTILVLVLLIRQTQESKAARYLLAVLLTSAFWQISRYLWPPIYTPLNLPFVFLLLTTVLLTITTFHYLDWDELHWLRYLTFSSLILFLLDWLLPNTLVPLSASQNFYLTIGGIFAQAVWFVMSVIAFWTTFIIYRRTSLPWHTNRLLYWLVALVTVFIGEVLLNFSNPVLVIIGHIIHLIGSIELTYAVLSHRIFDLRHRIRHAITLTIKGAFIAVPFLVIVTATLWFTNNLPPINQAAILLLVSSLSFLIYQPIYQLSDRFFLRWLIGERFETRMVVRNYSQAIARVLDVEQLSLVIVGTISEMLETTRGALILLTIEQNTTQLEPIPAMGHISREPFMIDNKSQFLQTLSNNHQPLLQYEIDFNPEFRDLSKEERTWLAQQEMEVYVPISSDSSLYALIALGPKNSGLTYRPSELELTQLLADQTGVALQNARLYRELGTQTEQIRKLNEDLIKQNERLEIMDKVKTDFINIASHELRTPLTQVKGYADILASMYEGSNGNGKGTQNIIDHISRSALRLERVISAMLDASQLDVQAMQLAFTKSSVETLVRLAAEPLRSAMTERNMVFIQRHLAELPAIQADFKRMVQALQYIINNALKYTPDGGTITIAGITVDSAEDDNQFIELTVSDTGIGIDSEYHELIFEKFFRIGDPQLHSTGGTKFKGAGPGLGLPIARGVIEAHGGRIWVESSGHDEQQLLGSTFHILIPVAPTSTLNAKTEPTKERPPWLVG